MDRNEASPVEAVDEYLVVQRIDDTQISISVFEHGPDAVQPESIGDAPGDEAVLHNSDRAARLTPDPEIAMPVFGDRMERNIAQTLRGVITPDPPRARLFFTHQLL